jgi:hypothetical protein
MSHGEPSPSLSATALQNLAAVLGAHALEESVGFLATAIIGLKRALHSLSRALDPMDQNSELNR